ncbi:MAG: hypothetical protein QM831_06380 [Kofleriaceae bacterium]
MRLVAWIFVVCSALAALGVFLPIVSASGVMFTKRERMSLFHASEQRTLVRRLLTAYRHANHHHLEKNLGKVLPHLHGNTKDYLEDAGDAMDTLSGISDEDAKRAGQALVILCWTIIGLAILMVLAVGPDSINGVFKRWHLVVALILALLQAALCVGVRIGMDMAVYEANDEIGASVVTIGSAATVLPVAAVGAFLTAITLLVLHVRQKRT